MKGIRSLITPLNVPLVKNKAVTKSTSLYTEAKDTFVRSETAKDIASRFRKQVIEPFKDWEVAFPADNEDGSQLLKDMLEPYTKSISKFCKKDAEQFARLVFGENQIKLVEEASVKNSAMRSFKETLEKAIGSPLTSLYPKN